MKESISLKIEKGAVDRLLKDDEKDMDLSTDLRATVVTVTEVRATAYFNFFQRLNKKSAPYRDRF